jgi:hypothetical protein
MSQPSPNHDHTALAASLRTWALAFVTWLTEALGAHALTRSMRRWAHAQLTHAEKGAAALIVFAAMRLLPSPPEALNRRGGKRPLSGPRGFARVCIHHRDMRGVLRKLFPRERCLLRRSARLARALKALGACARRIARRIRRILPASRLAAVRPPAAPCMPCADPCPTLAPDTS